MPKEPNEGEKLLAGKQELEKHPEPTLHLVRGPITVDDCMQLFKDLTGREPTPEEYAEAKAVFDEDAKKARNAK
jgi:hypothetical protein